MSRSRQGGGRNGYMQVVYRESGDSEGDPVDDGEVDTEPQTENATSGNMSSSEVENEEEPEGVEHPPSISDAVQEASCTKVPTARTVLLLR